MEVLETVRQALELGFPAIVLIALWLLWQEYRRMTREYIDALREIAGMRASLRASEPPSSASEPTSIRRQRAVADMRLSAKQPLTQFTRPIAVSALKIV